MIELELSALKAQIFNHWTSRSLKIIKPDETYNEHKYALLAEV